jgi:elongation factor Ts
MENYIEQCKIVRSLTMAPMKDVSTALIEAKGNVDAAIQLLLKRKAANAEDMANRVASTSIVHSYVHNNRVGAMIVLACQTDFVARNETFLQLAKDICMHIASSPLPPLYVDSNEIPSDKIEGLTVEYGTEIPSNKPEAIRQKIIDGKIKKFIAENCLVEQAFVKDETMTIKQLIQSVSATVGEKVELKKFVKLIAQ